MFFSWKKSVKIILIKHEKNVFSFVCLKIQEQEFASKIVYFIVIIL